MTRSPLIWIGLAGVAPDDNPRALAWQRRLHPYMVAIALLSVPAYFFDTALQHPDWHRVATVLDALIGIAIVTLLGAGGVFYWLDPGVNTYWEGLWLAFTTGTTVGYGDVVPATGASRAFAAFMVLVGVSLMTLFTANVVTFFIGREETELRSDLHHDIVKLRGELARLIGAEELRIHRDLHHEVRVLRDEVQALREALARPAAPDERGKSG
jgi:hypothetical protein